MEDVLHYASQTKTSLTRIMLDNMVVPLPNGDVDISMLKDAVLLVNGRFETEVIMAKFSPFKLYHIWIICCSETYCYVGCHQFGSVVLGQETRENG